MAGVTSPRRRREALALLGLARRAGAVVKGTEGVRASVRRNEARLVILAEDGSRLQQMKLRPILRARGIPWGVLGKREELGAAVGSGPVAALAVRDGGLARRISQEMGWGATGRAGSSRSGGSPGVCGSSS